MAATKKKPAQTNSNLYIVLALVTVLVLAIGGYAGKNLVGSIIHSGKVLAAKQTANNQLAKDITAAPQLIQSYKDMSPGAAQVLKDALPNTGDFPSLITMLENLGGQAGVKVTTVGVDQTAAVAPVTTTPTATTTDATATSTEGGASVNPIPQAYPVTVGLSGTYQAILKFFANTELSARPLRITSVDLTGNSSAMTATITVETYYESKAGLPFSTRTIK